MITLQIDDREVETIFVKGFGGNIEKFVAFIQNAYAHKESLEAYEADKERFLQTYKRIKDGSMKMYTQAEASKELDRFLETL